MVSSAVDPLAPLAVLPDVPQACESAREALAAVHRHRANLRGWVATSAESALRGARASAGIEGASVRIPSGTREVSDPILAGALRVAGDLHGDGLARAVAVWSRSPLQQLARLHVLAGTHGQLGPESLGRPRTDPGVAERLQALASLITGGTSAPAPVVAAVVHGEIATLCPFGSGDGIVARAASRLVSVAAGLDPHGLGVPEVSWYRDTAGYRAALGAFASGTQEGVGEWIRYSCRSLVDGAREAGSIADAASGQSAGS